MKVKKIVLLSSLLLLLGSVGTFVYYKSNVKDEFFDNSKPGLWKVKTNLSSSRTDFNGEQIRELCITQEIIENSKKKSLQSKFQFEGLNCQEHFSRVSENKATFTLSCNGVNPIKKNNVDAKLKGEVESNPESGFLTVEYEINNSQSIEKFNIITESQRIGDCEGK